ncbi:MAG: alpha/beta hydrolase [Lachnospiraceae bacterium]|nr:alpha/beta hydrolase [Lachnospiraceae bacterium]
MRYEELDIKAEGYEGTGKLVMYLLDNSPEMHPRRKRPLVLICPGGGYAMTSDREAEPLAMRFLAMGYHAAVLRYSVAPVRYPSALFQLAKSVIYLKEHADELFVDADRIVIQGSSAGGHLAASFGVFWNRPFLAEGLGVLSSMLKPAGLMLSYPVITSGSFAHRGSFENLLGSGEQELREMMSLEKQVTEDTPRTFLWHTEPDDVVPVENSILFFQALHEKGVPVEMHIYPVGGHGLGLADYETANSDGYGVQKECRSWIHLAELWMKNSFTTNCFS